MLTTMIRNWWTTLFGFLAGVANYALTNGAVVPGSKQEWMNFAFSAFLAGLGLTAKSATTGSKPQ